MMSAVVTLDKHCSTQQRVASTDLSPAWAELQAQAAAAALPAASAARTP